MKTPTWNDVENARDLHTGPQRDIPQAELIRSTPELLRQRKVMLAALKALLQAHYDNGKPTAEALQAVHQARAAIRQCEEGK